MHAFICTAFQILFLYCLPNWLPVRHLYCVSFVNISMLDGGFVQLMNFGGQNLHKIYYTDIFFEGIESTIRTMFMELACFSCGKFFSLLLSLI